MAGEHKVVCSETPIPIRILMRDDANIIRNSTLQNGFVSNNWIKEILDNHDYAKWKKIDMSFVGISSSKLGIFLHQAKKDSFHGVYVLGRSIVKQWWLSFFIYIDFENLFH